MEGKAADYTVEMEVYTAVLGNNKVHELDAITTLELIIAIITIFEFS
jgi:hypothetical protein